ncbi:hypothetical protein [Leifsonia sp. AG29]|uniref:hypothetical protein n=1 Tax=Leifsonia sp. AG29 TaxID=2598860 RepID=UPI00131CC1FE|nr:hypothetical protein [Leifsonia sp. AG29]
MGVRIISREDGVTVVGENYEWRLDEDDAAFRLRDARGRLVAHASAQPSVQVVVAGSGETREFPGVLSDVAADTAASTVTLRFTEVNGDAATTVTWEFGETWLRLAPVRYSAGSQTHVETMTLFARWEDHQALPGLHSQFFLHPGSTESSILAPVIPAKVRLSITSTIGRGSTDEPAYVQQQWALPLYFWGGWSIDGWSNTRSALTTGKSDVFVMGLEEIPTGDQHIRYFDEYASPFLRVFGSSWKTYETGEEELTLGTGWIWAFGPDIRSAIAAYYELLQKRGIVRPRVDSPRKALRATMSQFNTWGAQTANDWAASDLTQEALERIYDDLVASGLDAEMFVIDDRWEAAYGRLEHDADRFPEFEAFLDRVRADGRAIGMWAAFIRCQDPESLGLTVEDVLRDPDGNPVTRALFDQSYYLFDVSRPHVAERLAETARRFMRRYRPDLIKFDFGYELPSMRHAAPARREWGGERILLESLRVIVGAMREVDPDVVVMYYNLSPLLAEFVDQHSTDDLYLNAGEYAEEVNRRVFFSSLLSPLGVPTYGSGGYDWTAVRDIWFDTVASGPLGSLNSFNGDQSDTLPSRVDIARQRGLRQLTRRTTRPAQIEVLEARTHGGSLTAHARSWLRREEGGLTVAALRCSVEEGVIAPAEAADEVRTTCDTVIASRDDEPIHRARSLGAVAAGSGDLRFRTVHRGAPSVVAVVAGREEPVTPTRHGDWVEIPVTNYIGSEPVEWYRIEFAPTETA